MTSANVTRIGIAVLRQGRRYAIGVRSEGQVLSGHAEFPGGKCEPGENPLQTTLRECEEETGLFAQPLRPLCITRHTYDHGSVELHFWLCEPEGEATELRPPFRWVDHTDLGTLDFPEANAEVLDILFEETL